MSICNLWDNSIKHDSWATDLSPLNEYCDRKTFAISESPFHLARKIRKNTWNTSCD